MFAWNMIPAALSAAALVVAPTTVAQVNAMPSSTSQVTLAANETVQDSTGFTAVFLDGTKVWPIKTAPVQQVLNCAFCELDSVTVDYPRSMSLSSVPKGLAAFTQVVDNTPGFLVVVGYSQGVEVAEKYQEQQVASGDPSGTDRMLFYFFGDPDSETDVENNPYSTIKIAYLYDGIAILPGSLLFNPIAFANMVSGIFQLHTEGYADDIDLTNALVRQNGNTTHYLVIPEHLPLLQGWYDAGLGFMVSWIEPTLTKIVLSAYKDVLSEYAPVNQQPTASRYAVESTELALTEPDQSFTVPVDSSAEQKQPEPQAAPTPEPAPVQQEQPDAETEQPANTTEVDPTGSDNVEEAPVVTTPSLGDEEEDDTDDKNLDEEAGGDAGQEDDSSAINDDSDDSKDASAVSTDDNDNSSSVNGNSGNDSDTSGHAATKATNDSDNSSNDTK